MNLQASNPRFNRRKTDFDVWEKTIDSLAMAICPAEEWREYEQRIQQLAWRSNAAGRGRSVKVFPIWRKYRQQALRVATLHQAVPVLRRLPLRLSCALGDLLFQ